MSITVTRRAVAAVIALGAFAAAPARAQIEVIYTKIPGHPTSVVPGALDLNGNPAFTEWRALEDFAFSPDGQNWVIKGRTQLGSDLETILVKGSLTTGTMFAQEGQPIPSGAPGELFDFFGSGLGRWNNLNHFAYSARARGGVAAVFQKVIYFDGGTSAIAFQMGDLITGLMDLAPNPSGDETFGNSVGSIHPLDTGVIGSQDSTILNIHTSRRPAIMYDRAAFHQTNVTSVASLDGMGTELWKTISANTFYTSPDGAHWIAAGQVNQATTMDAVLVVDERVVMQESFAIPGSTVIMNAVFNNDISAGGAWYARGDQPGGNDWAVVSGVVVAKTGDPITPGGAENWGAVFSAFHATDAGDWVLVGNTTNPDTGLDNVVVLNGETVLVREGDQVDLDGDGVLDDAFIGRGNNTLSAFEPNDFFLANDGYLYFFASLRNAAGQDLNSDPAFGSPQAFMRLQTRAAPPGITIDGFDPPAGREGDVIRVFGSGFGQNPDNVCAVVMQPNGADATPMQVIAATDTEILAVLGAVDPEFVPGQIMIGLGNGTRGTFQPIFRDVIPEDPDGTWVWDRAGGPAAVAPGEFVPLPVEPPPAVQWFFGRVVNGRLCVFIDGNWMRNSYVQVHGRLHNHQMGMGTDMATGCVRLRLGGTAEHCAQRLCDVIRCAFLREGIVVNCRADPVPGSTAWKITVSKKDAAGNEVPIDWGNLNICVQMPRKFRLPRGFEVTPFFNADIMPVGGDPGPIRVANIGSSGQDGVSVDVRDARDGAFVDTELISMSLTGGQFALHTWGTVAGEPGTFLGGGGLRGIDSFFDVFADFSDIGAATVRVQGYRNGQLVLEGIAPNGSVGRVLPGPGGLNIDGCGKLPPDPPCIWIDPFPPVFLQLLGGQSAEVDQVRLLADDAPGGIDSIELLDITAANVPKGSFVINDAMLLGPACPCDWNNSGAVNSQDFFDFLNDFFAGDADYNNDGLTNSQDFFDFLNCFFNPPKGC